MRLIRTVETDAGDRERRPALLSALRDRGMVRSTAVGLLAGRSGDELAKIQDWVEYFDDIDKEKTPGLLENFIRNADDGLPTGFETSRQREARRANKSGSDGSARESKPSSLATTSTGGKRSSDTSLLNIESGLRPALR